MKFYPTTPPVSVLNEGDIIPNKFVIFQNYPNPFNPTTEIRFEVPVSGFVSLKVYNVLGREIATIVNEQKNPGAYSVQWNASAQPSGVYYYRMLTGSFSETKKLVLVR